MELLEREGALGELDAHLEQAARGSGRVVLLHGEAGVGKTAVVREFASRADPAVRVLYGACDPLTTPRPLGPVLDFARLLGDPLPPSPPAPAPAPVPCRR